jgi:hypothetical protein
MVKGMLQYAESKTSDAILSFRKAHRLSPDIFTFEGSSRLEVFNASHD